MAIRGALPSAPVGRRGLARGRATGTQTLPRREVSTLTGWSSFIAILPGTAEVVDGERRPHSNV